MALVARGDHVHVEVRGSLSIGGPAAQRDSQFRHASTTKPVTGAATLALVDEGLLALDEPVDHWLPELAVPRVLRRTDGPLDDTVEVNRSITARDLLTFTFGFGMAVEMFMSDEPWPVVKAASELGLSTLVRRNQTNSLNPMRGSRPWDRCRSWHSRASAGSTTPAPRCRACCWHAWPRCHSPRCCAHGSSSLSPCPTPPSGHRTWGAWRRRSSRLSRVSRPGTFPTANGAGRRLSAMVRPAWSRLRRTCWRSGA